MNILTQPTLTMRLLFALITTCLLLLSHTPIAYSQNSSDLSTTLNNNALNNSSLSNSALASNPFSALATGEEFLKVDEAYQLSLSFNDTELIAEWIIADAYFLYGEQFKFNINGTSIKAKLPEGKVEYDEIFEKDVEKHYAYVRASIPREVINTLASDQLQLAITYQGCADAGLCYPPETKAYTLDISNGSIEPTSLTPPTKSPTVKPELGLITLIMLCSALFGGVLLNLMPCVFPVLSIKALSLTQSQDTRERIRHGWSYTIGCLLTFVLIAGLLLIIRDTGKAVGWGFQLQSPGVVTVLALLFIVMGLSLSGLINIGGRWVGAGQSLTQGHSYSSSFFTGVLASVVASPCTAPFMATALGYALTQPTGVALGIFAALGLGMALPFLLLSYSPQLGQRLPKPGPWMDTFKQALAFPLYLTAIWLLWVLSHQTGSDSVILVALLVVAILFGIWLSDKLPRLKVFTALAGLLLMALVVGKNQQTPTIEHNNNNTLWQTYSQEALSQARSQGKVVFINLTADWCITCKINEKLVFTEHTLNDMKNRGVVLLEGDWTNYNPEITSLLDRYGRAGVPLYLLFPQNPNMDAEILPQILKPASFKSKIDKVLKNNSKIAVK